MKINGIDVHKIIEQATVALEKNKTMSVALKTLFKTLLMILVVLLERVTKNSSNSSIRAPGSSEEETRLNVLCKT